MRSRTVGATFLCNHQEIAMEAHAAPAALSLLTPVADGLWERVEPFATGPIRLDHRMTVARLPADQLWIHSPVSYSPKLGRELRQLGEVAHLVAPSRFHDLAWREWFDAYPACRFHAAPGVAADHPELPFTDELSSGSAFDGHLESLVLSGLPKLNETVFLHTPSRSLLVADLVFNYEGYEAPMDWATSLTLRLAGTHRRLAVSRFLRSLIKDRGALRTDLDRVFDWEIERVQVGHGLNVEADGGQRLRRAWSFL
jgi:hypothetical protein